MKRRYRSLILPFLFLCAISAYSAVSLIGPSYSFQKQLQHQVADLNLTPHKKNRGIASVEQANTVTFDCDKQNQSTQLYSAQVFIKFENCQIKQKISDYKLINQTNQYMAQIFRPSAGLITTDFIQLARGENILKFEISLNDKQKKTQIIKIQRLASEIQ